MKEKKNMWNDRERKKSERVGKRTFMKSFRGKT